MGMRTTVIGFLVIGFSLLTPFLIIIRVKFIIFLFFLSSEQHTFEPREVHRLQPKVA